MSQASATNVLQLYDFFVETLGHRTVAYLELEYCAGGDLASLINSSNTGAATAVLQQKQHALPLQSIVNIATGVCAALQQLHALKIVHRDVKPSNVLFTTVYTTANMSAITVDSVKLCDLGVSTQLINSSSNSSSSTSNSSDSYTVNAAGTPPYWAPEVYIKCYCSYSTTVYRYDMMYSFRAKYQLR
jgi:serine/threonine protein kinase